MLHMELPWRVEITWRSLREAAMVTRRPEGWGVKGVSSSQWLLQCRISSSHSLLPNACHWSWGLAYGSIVASFLTDVPPGLSPKGFWLLQKAPGFGGTYFMCAFFLVGLLETLFLFLPYTLGGPLCTPWRSCTEALGEAGEKEATKEDKRKHFGG